MDNGSIPEKFGDYLTLRDREGAAVVLGSGGFGTTVCAYRSRMIGGETIRDEGAVKILRTQAIEDPKRRRAFVDEIVALRDLQHPNLVRYIDCGEQDGSIFLIMDLCRGGDLEKLVQTLGPFTERAALQATLQVCAGLDEAHRKNYLHRDLKPRNVLLGEAAPEEANLVWLEEGLARASLRLKIVDFGLAGRLGGDIATTGFVGSPMFASPEQVRQRRDLDVRSDLYSLGMTLWYLVMGKGPLLRPDGRPIDDAKEAMRAHTSPIAHELAFPTTFSPEFRQLLSRMVKKPREERFASVGEMMQAIRFVLDRTAAQSAAGEMAPAAGLADKLPLLILPRQPDWAKGKFGDYYRLLGEEGRRAPGKLYRAGLERRIENQFVTVPEGTEVRLTAWVPEREPASECELELADHLSRLWGATWSTLAPASLARILEVRRTASEWFVCEEWAEGFPLEALLTARGRSLTMEEVAALLMPAAEAADFLHQNNFEGALLTVADLRLFNYDRARNEEAWLKRPVETWGNWGLQVSGIALPAELTGAVAEVRGLTATGTSAGLEVSQLTLTKAFARLLYRLVEGIEIAEAADWDEHAYEDAGKLSGPSNLLLRECVCGGRDHVPAVEILRQVCKNEGVFRMPERGAGLGASRFGNTSARSFERSSMAPDASMSSVMNTVSLSDLGEADLDLGADFDAPTIVGPPRLPPATPASRSAPAPPPPLPAGQSNRIPPPPLPPAGSGASARGSRLGDSISGSSRRIACILRQGEVPEARSPFVEDEASAWQPLKPGDWRAGAAVRCAVTGREFVLPAELPMLAVQEGAVAPSVRSPFPPHENIKVPAEQWSAGAEVTLRLAAGPECRVQLPNDILPPGRIAPEKLGLLPAGALGLQPQAREHGGAIRSPYGEQPWMEVAAKDWLAGNRLLCPATQRPFWLPADLPALVAELAPTAGSVWSPFTKKEIAIPPWRWQEGEVFACPETGGDFQLPLELPLLEGRLDPARVGFVESPFDPGQFFKAGQRLWLPGEELACPVTRRKFRLPAQLPEWLPEAEVVDAAHGLVRNPLDARAAFAVKGEEWIAGNTVLCGTSGDRVILPATLPPMEASPVSGKPGFVSSPYISGGYEQKISRGDWKPGQLVACGATGRPMQLPETLPPLPVRKSSAVPIMAGLATLLLLVGVVGWLALGFLRPPAASSTPAPAATSVLPTSAPEPKPDVSPEAWPATFVFQGGIAPAPPEAKVRLKAGEQLSTELPAKPDDGAISVELTAALKQPPFATAPALELQISANGFSSQTVPLKKVRGGLAYRPASVGLQRQTASLAFHGQPPPYYTGIRCTAGDGSEITGTLAQKLPLPLGTYKVTFFSRDTRFAEREVAAALKAEAGRPAELEFPPFPFRKRSGGLYQREMSGLSTRVFKNQEAGSRGPTLNPEPFTVRVWTPELLVFDEGGKFVSGALYELNARAMVDVVVALDNLCYLALILGADKAKVTFDKAPNAEPIFQLADDFRATMEAPFEAAPAAQRAKLRDLANRIRALLPKNIATVFPNDAKKTAAIAPWAEYVERFVAILGPAHDDAWAAVLQSCRQGSALPPGAIEALATSILGHAGIMVENRFTVGAYDGANALDLNIKRYQGESSTLNWTPRFEAAGPAWTLSDIAVGGETKINLRAIE